MWNGVVARNTSDRLPAKKVENLRKWFAADPVNEEDSGDEI
jgi:hypothetical protein